VPVPAQCVYVDQTWHYRLAAIALQREDKLIDEALAAPPAMRQQILQFFHPAKM
jgi:hypothetical protein